MLIPINLLLTQLLEQLFEPHSDWRDHAQRVVESCGEADGISLCGFCVLHELRHITDIEEKLVVLDVPINTQNLMQHRFLSSLVGGPAL